MRLIREAVLECTGTTFKRGDYVRRYQNRTERSITAGDSLPYQDEVGLDIPVLHRERRASTPHAAHDFVGDEKDFVVATDFRNALRVAVWRNRRAECRADNRLENKGGHGAGVIFFKKNTQVLGARGGTVGKSFVVRTAIAGTRRNVS